jgi:hypothetical protein
LADNDGLFPASAPNTNISAAHNLILCGAGAEANDDILNDGGTRSLLEPQG